MDVDPDGGPLPALNQLILAQTALGIGVPVLLRTGAPGPEEVDPFGEESYRVQVGLAARLMEAGSLDRLVVDDPAARDVAPRLLERPLLALNFHGIEPEHFDVVREQLTRAASLGPTFDLDATHAVGEVRVLFAFYDGFADTAAFAADVCHDLGLRAVFFPLTSAEHGARLVTDVELADLATAHEVGWHTANHMGAEEVDADDVETEVVEPFRRIEQVTGRAPRIGAWCFGSRFDPDRPGNPALVDLGLTHLVSNWSVERV
ncbi:polysaccharide deacetylase family protein [Microlunatus antarcticus]|uniref:NodB homology domain-containing protein n=1 Tax=Microlunatus antarcticus TaxID=53388 RepID=A0A7W5JT88_9ACTN|nr:hypothetical protein [Microlunatus antarcticus]